VEFIKFTSLSCKFKKKIQIRICLEITCKIMIEPLFLKQCLNIRGIFLGTFSHNLHIKNVISCTTNYGSHGQSITVSTTVWQGTKAVDLSLTHISRNVTFPCCVSLKTKLMSRIRESIQTFKQNRFVAYIAVLLKHRTLPASITKSLRQCL